LRWLRRRIAVALPVKLALGAFAIAALAGAAGYGTQRGVLELGARSWMAAIAAVGVFGVVYLVGMAAAKVPEARAFTRRLLRR
jgi:hypothetical protein